VAVGLDPRAGAMVAFALMISEGDLKTLESRLQTVAGGRISTFCRLKPELQQPPTGVQDTL
jgi:hypothetical protein